MATIPHNVTKTNPEYIRLRHLYAEVGIQLSKAKLDIVQYDISRSITQSQDYILEQFIGCLQHRYSESIQQIIAGIIEGLLSDPKQSFWEGFNGAFGQAWQNASGTHIELLNDLAISKARLDQHFTVLKRQTDLIVQKEILDREARVQDYLQKLFDFNFWIKNGKERHFQKYTAAKVEKVTKDAADITQNCIYSLAQVRVNYTEVVPESVQAETIGLINEDRITGFLNWLGTQAEENHKAGMKKSKEFSVWNIFKIKYVFKK